jgi:anti-sigma factor RsiW
MVDERVQALINAELDGELDAAGQAELQKAFASSDEARKLYEDLVVMNDALARMVREPTPPGLREAIMSAVRAMPAPKGKVLAFPSLQGRRREATKVGFALAAGVALGAVGLYLFQPESTGFDPTQLSGAMVRGADETEVANLRIETPAVQGTAALYQGEGVLVLQFDLDSPAPVAVSADYDEAGLRLMGLAQGAVQDADIRSSQGTVGYLNQGERRFVVYLARSNPRGGVVRLSFQAGGAVVHEATLQVPAKGGKR